MIWRVAFLRLEADVLRLRTRGLWGVQAGMMAGIAIAGAFFVLDLARGDPLGTPLALSRSLFESDPGFAAGGLFGSIAEFSPGGRLAAFTAAYLAAWAVLGVLAAALANLFHLHWNSRNGGVLGLLLGVLTWLIVSRAGPVWMTSAHLTPEVVLGAGLVGGWTLGWYLRACRLDAEEDG